MSGEEQRLREVYGYFKAVYEMISTPEDRRPTFEEMFEDVLEFSRDDPAYGALTMALGTKPCDQAIALESEKEALRRIFLEELAVEVKKKSVELGELIQSYVNSTWPLSLFWRAWMFVVELELADVHSFVHKAVFEAKQAGRSDDDFRIVTDVLAEAARTNLDYSRAVGAN